MESYSSALRPVEDTDKALNVTLQITLSQIKDMVGMRALKHWMYCEWMKSFIKNMQRENLQKHNVKSVSERINKFISNKKRSIHILENTLMHSYLVSTIPSW